MSDLAQALESSRKANVAGNFRAALDLARSALAEAGESDRPLAAKAAMFAAKAAWNIDEIRVSAEMVGRAVRLCEGQAELLPMLAEALALSGACHARLEEPVPAVHDLRAAVALLGPQLPQDVRRDVYVGVGLGYQCLGLALHAAQAYRQALDIVRASGGPAMKLRASMNLCYAVEQAVWQQQRSSPEKAGRLLGETLALQSWMQAQAQAIGTPHANTEYLDAISRLLVLAGRDDEAKAALEQLLDQRGDAASDLRCDWHLALLRLAQRRGDEAASARHLAAALEAAGDALAEPGTTGDMWRAAELLAFQGQARAALDMAWRFHSRVLANETASLEARLEEISATLAHRTLQLQVADLRERNESLAEREGELELLSRVDPLTGVWNRRWLEAEFAKLIASQRRIHLMMLDLDHFKRVNDTHGHAVGDLVLKGVTTNLAAALRVADSLGRLGGEEFLVLIGESSPPDALAVARRLHDVVGRIDWQRTAPGLSVSFSAGLVAVGEGESFTQALARADALLYQAKTQGRNRIVAEGAA